MFSCTTAVWRRRVLLYDSDLTTHCSLVWQHEQLQHHEQRVKVVDRDLHEHRKYPPEKGSKARVIQEYVEKEQYLQYEVGLQLCWWFKFADSFLILSSSHYIAYSTCLCSLKDFKRTCFKEAQLLSAKFSVLKFRFYIEYVGVVISCFCMWFVSGVRLLDIVWAELMV